MTLENSSKQCSVPSEVFKKPSNRAPKKAKIVLDEDQFVKGIESIIERDFFPDIPKLRAQVDYQQALEENDILRLRDLQQKYGPRFRPGTGGSLIDGSTNSPATFDTPASRGDRTPSKNLENLNTKDPTAKDGGEQKLEDSLDTYLAKTTSEDNSSFAQIMEESERKHRIKYAWLYDKEKEHAQYMEKVLALPSVEDQATDQDRVACVDNWSYTNQNSLMYVPDGVDFTAQELLELGKKKREIAFGNTRFERSPFNEQINRIAISEAAQLIARNKEGKIGVDGKELVPTSNSPKINGYGFVATPSPAPGVEESPLMTWGEIEGTPFRLDGGDTPVVQSQGPSFRIQDVPARDKLAMELAEKVSRKPRETKLKALQTVQANLRTPTPYASQAERLASMSPAAQRLASSKLGINLGSDKSLRLSYTPSPVHHQTPTRKGKSTPRLAGAAWTPSNHNSKGGGHNGENSVSITDNLLNLPRRNHAVDFFKS